jgi:hypothetical protein
MRRATVWGGAVAALVLGAAPARAQLPPTEYEQYMLELINRARANPNAEVVRLSGFTWGNTGSPATPDLNEGLAPGTISSAAKQPIALNTRLIQAAVDYSNTLLANDAFTHTFGGTSPSSRMTAAGYTFSAPAGAGENLAVTASSGPHTVTRAVVDQHHVNLFIDGNVTGRGHRINLMNASWREVGLGIRAGTDYDFFATLPNANAVITTQDFAFTGAAGGGPFITGVAYRELNGDNFYTPGIGEALGNYTVTAFLANTSTQAGTATTFASGGYGISVAPNQTYDVLFANGGNSWLFQDVGVTTLNVKVDLIQPIPEPAGSLLLVGAAAAGGVTWRQRRTAI